MQNSVCCWNLFALPLEKPKISNEQIPNQKVEVVKFIDAFAIDFVDDLLLLLAKKLLNCFEVVLRNDLL